MDEPACVGEQAVLADVAQHFCGASHHVQREIFSIKLIDMRIVNKNRSRLQDRDVGCSPFHYFVVLLHRACERSNPSASLSFGHSLANRHFCQ
jgi:hypothetical protein